MAVHWLVDPPVHGKLSRVSAPTPTPSPVTAIADCPQDFPVTRYHSLVVDEDTLPEELTVTSRTEAGAIAGADHVTRSFGGQFTWIIASVAGYRILANFLRICGREVPTGDDLAALGSQVLRLDEQFRARCIPDQGAKSQTMKAAEPEPRQRREAGVWCYSAACVRPLPTVSSACDRSAMMSSICSIPTDS